MIAIPNPNPTSSMDISTTSSVQTGYPHRVAPAANRVEPRRVVSRPPVSGGPRNARSSGTLEALARCLDSEDKKAPTLETRPTVIRASSDGFDRDQFQPINFGFALAEEHEKQKERIPRKSNPTSDSPTSLDSPTTTTTSSSSTTSTSSGGDSRPETTVLRQALHVKSFDKQAMPPPPRAMLRSGTNPIPRSSVPVQGASRHSIGTFHPAPRMVRMQTNDDSKLQIARERRGAPKASRSSFSFRPFSSNNVGLGLKASGKEPKKKASRFSISKMFSPREAKWDPEEVELKQWILYQRLFRNSHITDKHNGTFPVDSQWVQKGFCLIGDIIGTDGKLDWDGIQKEFEPSVHKVVRTQLDLILKAIPKEWIAVLKGSSRPKDRAAVREARGRM